MRWSLCSPRHDIVKYLQQGIQQVSINALRLCPGSTQADYS